MRERRRRIRSRLLERIATAIFAVGFSSSLFFTFNVFADVNLFVIQDAELVEISTTAEGDIESFDETNIVSHITSNMIGDTAKYKITLKNTDDEAHVIESITNDNDSNNPYVTYEHDSYANTTVAPGASLDFIITAKYTSAAASTNTRAIHTANANFTIQYSDPKDSEEESEKIPMIPNTGLNTGPNAGGADFCSTTTLIISSIGLIICAAFYIKSHRKSARILGVAITFVAMTAVAVGVKVAETFAIETSTEETSGFTLATNFTVKPGRIIHYDGSYPDDGKMDDDQWSATGTLKPNAYIVYGYHFTGWAVDEYGDKVYEDEEPMRNIPNGDDTLILYAFWEPNVYTINFHANSDQATSTMNSITVEYDSYERLPENEFVLDGYRFIGWKIDNEGDLISSDNRADVFEVENGATVNLYAQWEVLPIGIDYYPNGSDVSGTTSRQERYGRTVTLATPNFRRDGYGFAGWNTEPDGAGTMYGPNEVIAAPTTTLKLYATWVKAEEGITMQTFDDTAEPYTSYPNGKVIALKDNRDNQVYTVAKLTDGKWWMTENLRLIPAEVQFTPENTNNPSVAFLSASPLTSLCMENTVACINTLSYNSSNLRTNHSSYLAYGKGVYYNAFTATAGHAAVDPDNLVDKQVAGDICPKGWHLPTSGSNGDFKNLDISLGRTRTNSFVDFAHAQKYFKAPINLVTAGWAEGYTFHNIDTDAIYFGTGSYGMEQSTTTFVDVAAEINGSTSPKNHGHTVRCIAN